MQVIDLLEELCNFPERLIGADLFEVSLRLPLGVHFILIIGAI